jgi:hypothetical protein
MAIGDWKSLINIAPDLFKYGDHVADADLYKQAAQQAQNANQLAQAQNMPMNMDQINQMMAQQVHHFPHAQAQANTGPTPHDRARSLLLARLGGITGSYRIKPEDFLWCHITPDLKTVHVFFVFGDQAGNTSEDSAMFPSDTLITQFRLLIP